MMNSKNVLHAVCIWLVVCKSAEGNDRDCTEDCACCKDRKCGPGEFFYDECIKGCIDGYACARCYNKCPDNCKKCISERNEEYCIVCHDGYHLGPGRDCTSKCLIGCKTCVTESTCISCNDGYYDTNHSCNSLCPVNCVTCSSNTKCESCKDGFYNGYLYDNRSLPLSQDCKYKCRDNCLQCSSYDSCGKCRTGLYGQICRNSCSLGCLNGNCEFQTGSCACTPNFAGSKCNKCKNGHFGNICDKQCSSGCKNNLCEKESGNCTHGCTVDTIVGDKCDVCSIGWYGPNCNVSCSNGCKNRFCSRNNGDCMIGCLNNFRGKQCDQCIRGKYGDHCNSDCSSNCDEQGCLKKSGHCIKCVENFDGERCDRCVIGLYGSACKDDCPSKCLKSKCKRDSDSRSSESAKSYATLILGTFLVVSVVGNIMLVATMILLKFRQRENTNKMTGRPLYENTDMELQIGISGDMNHYPSILQAPSINQMTRALEYENLHRDEVLEHEYGQIQAPNRSN